MKGSPRRSCTRDHGEDRIGAIDSSLGPSRNPCHAAMIQCRDVEVKKKIKVSQVAIFQHVHNFSSHTTDQTELAGSFISLFDTGVDASVDGWIHHLRKFYDAQKRRERA